MKTCVTHHRCDCTEARLKAIEAKCAELQGLYDSEYNHTQALRNRCAFQAEMLERAREYIDMCYDESGTGTAWLADLEKGPK